MGLYHLCGVRASDYCRLCICDLVGKKQKDADGHIEYRRDVYGRDAELFSAMKAQGVDTGPEAPNLAGAEGGVELAADQG